MTRYIAFLRAINVGGHNVKMTDLRQLFIDLGFDKVETFIASGNVIFDAPTSQMRELESEIETHLQQALGYAVATFLRTIPEVAAAAHDHPFAASVTEAGSTLYVAFLRSNPDDEAQRRVMTFKNAINDFHFQRRELYWLRRTATQASDFSGAVLEKTLKAPATIRNITTVKKLAAKVAV